MTLAIKIDPANKKIGIVKIDSLNGKDDGGFITEPLAQIEEGLFVYSFPVLSPSGRRLGAKCFLCAEYDIIEIEGIALVPLKNGEDAQECKKKIENMIVWEQI